MELNGEEQEVFYQIALTMVPQVGVVHSRNLLEKFGTAQNVFRAKRSLIEQVDGIGYHRAKKIKGFSHFNRVEAEIKFLARYRIRTLLLNSPGYPRRLLNCYDPPTLLFYKGNADLNLSRIISVVGTRMNTSYGQQMVELLVKELASANVLVVSGLAFGIDAIAHRACLKYGVPTVGVVAHGLDTVYPSQHSSIAREMIQSGGLLSEFISHTKPDRHNFPTRNRIVAGMSDATIVVETSSKGGSIITANIANSYNRDVFAFPGRANDPMSSGTNMLIRTHRALLITSAQELLDAMGWETERLLPAVTQRILFEDLSPDERLVVEVIRDSGKVMIDELCFQSKMSNTTVASALLSLEMQGIVRCLPGKYFELL